jgi:RNA polymerase sigma-70 factor (sigma-E family)
MSGLGPPPSGAGDVAPVTFDSYVRRQSAALLRLAYLLTGDHHRANDLVQTTLTKVLPRWENTVARGDPHAYVRTVMVHTAIGWRRRKWVAERPTNEVPDWPGERDPVAAVDHRQRLRRALLRLPPRQRAAVVLRHYEDMSEAQTASALGCSVGTVKSQTAKGLDRLRLLLNDE